MEEFVDAYPYLFPHVQVIDRHWFEKILKQIFKANRSTLKTIDDFLSKEKYEITSDGKKQFQRVSPSTAEALWSWTRRTPLARLKVVICGQDPYPISADGDCAADGLAFSVNSGFGTTPPSLACIFEAVRQQCPNTDLTRTELDAWADQGVLLLNTILTCGLRPKSHEHLGWTAITYDIFHAVSEYARVDLMRTLIFLLWGSDARHLTVCRSTDGHYAVDVTHHVKLESRHPSPMADHYFGKTFAQLNDHFSEVNEILKQWNETPIDWSTEMKQIQKRTTDDCEDDQSPKKKIAF